MQQKTKYVQLPLFTMPSHAMPAPSQQPDGLFGCDVTVVNDDGVATTYHADGTISVGLTGEKVDHA